MRFLCWDSTMLYNFLSSAALAAAVRPGNAFNV